MSMLLLAEAGAGASTPATTSIEDVFAAYTRAGTGASATVTTGIDLSTKAGLVWTKGRSGATSHKITDTKRGVTKAWSSDSTAGDATDTQGLTAFSSTGYTIGTDSNYNTNAATYVDWTMREAANFLSITQFVGDNTATGRTISHTLGTAPGMVIVVCDDATLGHYVWHRSATSGNFLLLNTTAAQSSTLAATFFGNGTSTVDPSATLVTVGLGLNVLNQHYTVYCFGHDTSATGLIQCGTFTTDASGVSSTTLGFESQFIIVKKINGTSTWLMVDTARALTTLTGSGRLPLSAGDSSAEGARVGGTFGITSTGFETNGFFASATLVYIAIRHGPMKLPTVGTQVYNAIARAGTGAPATVTGVGFPPDLLIGKVRDNAGYIACVYDRLRGSNEGLDLTTVAENLYVDALNSFSMTGCAIGTDNSGLLNPGGPTVIYEFFRRYPGVFDEVCYTTDGSGNYSGSHNLKVSPEMIIVKARGVSELWSAYHTGLTSTSWRIYPNSNAQQQNDGAWISFSATTFAPVGLFTATQTYVAYLFATLAGISKVGSYTGNGTSLTLNMGFAAGARFFMCKRTDNTGDWFVWDSVRGIIAGNDPHLSLNTTAAEVTTDDSVDPDNSGIIVNEIAATHINVNGGTYVFLSFS